MIPNIRLIPVTPEIRSQIQEMLERERAILQTLRHYSGDDCMHCDCSSSIQWMEVALETGLIEEPEFDDDDMGEL